MTEVSKVQADTIAHAVDAFAAVLGDGLSAAEVSYLIVEDGRAAGVLISMLGQALADTMNELAVHLGSEPAEMRAAYTRMLRFACLTRIEVPDDR